MKLRPFAVRRNRPGQRGEAHDLAPHGRISPAAAALAVVAAIDFSSAVATLLALG